MFVFEYVSIVSRRLALASFSVFCHGVRVRSIIIFDFDRQREVVQHGKWCQMDPIFWAWSALIDIRPDRSVQYVAVIFVLRGYRFRCAALRSYGAAGFGWPPE